MTDTLPDSLMSLPPVIERLKQKVLPAELAGWLRRQFDWEHYFAAPRVVPFQELFYRFSIHLQESSINLMQTPEDDPFWRDAPKSQAFEPVLNHYVRSELGKRPDDEPALWTLAALAVGHCDNEFGRESWIRLCVNDLRNVRWMVESAAWVLFESGHDTTTELRESLTVLERMNLDSRHALQRFADGPDEGLRRAVVVALSLVQGGTVGQWLTSTGLPGPQTQARREISRRLRPYDKVRIVTERFRDEGAPPGTIGYIIEKWEEGVFEVEVSRQDGTTVALVTARDHEIEPAE